jgi:hypothetical protein
MNLVEHFTQPRVVRDAEKIIRDEKATIRFNDGVRKRGFAIIYNACGQIVIYSKDEILPNEEKDEL